MIRKMDYWPVASAATPPAPPPSTAAAAAATTTTNIVIVNNNRGSASAPSANASNAFVREIVSASNNNNEEGFGDKNGRSATAAVASTSTEGGVHRHSTVIVKMAHDKGERIEVSDGLVEEDDLIEEEPEEMLIEEDEETDTKALDSSLEMVDIIVEEQEEEEEVEIIEKVLPKKISSKAKGYKSTLTPNKSTTSSSSVNSSYEEKPKALLKEQVAAMVATTSTPSPDHHARRPMNAFLIFCKKHRPIVREKYPNLENRAITKILGDWWANLEKKDQDPFKCLASDYKDAFLSANPSFKWYKLPAPPLRTLSTRPTNSDRSYGDMLANGLNPVQKLSATSTPLIKQQRAVDYVEYEVEYGEQPMFQRRRGGKNNIQLFKLADENQMGGLSNLMGGGGGLDRGLNDNNNNKTHGDGLSDEDLIIEEGATSAVLNFANMRTHAARMEVTPKRKLTDVHSEFQAMKRAKKRADDFEVAVAESTGKQQQEIVGQKSPRACKGKKYLEFIKSNKTVAAAATATSVSQLQTAGPMGNGQASASTSTVMVKKVLQPQPQQIIVQQVGFPHNGYCKPQPVMIVKAPVVKAEQEEEGDEDEYEKKILPKKQAKQMMDISTDRRKNNGSGGEGGVIKVDQSKEERAAEAPAPVVEQPVKVGGGGEPQNNGKLFDASDFELDSKIGALPALSLDMYLTRKRETKKKKKIGGRKGHHARKQVSHSGPSIHEVKAELQKVGSQKRKARKESITRRDVSGEAEEVAEEETSGNASDLLILATLAAEEMETHQE